MKKLLACLLVLSLALAGLTAMALEAADVVGTWYINSVEMNGATMNPATLGVEMTFTLNEDGTVQMIAMGTEESGDWTLEGDTVMVDGVAFTLADGNLTGEIQAGLVAVFGQEQATAEAYEGAPVVAAADISDFDGEWQGTLMVVSGISIPIDASTMTFTASITNGAIKLTSAEGEKTETTEMQGTIENGMILATDESGEAAVPVQLELREDGTMSVTYSADAVDLQIYFEPAASPDVVPEEAA